MNQENETDKQKMESASEEFSGVIDATSEFLKKTFPYAYTMIDKLRGIHNKKANDGTKNS